MRSVVRRLCAVFTASAAVGALLWGCAGGGESDNGSGGSAGSSDAASDSSVGGSAGSGATGGGGSGGTSGSSGTGGVGASGGSAGADASVDASEDAGDAAPDGDAAGEPIPCNQIPEDCNGLDDNCNGEIDEGNPGGGGTCTMPGKQGVCVDGTLTCQTGALACVQNVQPTSETCNGLDDNCDGVVDDNNPGGNEGCNTGKQGICAAGTTNCNNGAIECLQNAQPQTEICNGLDDDCNGTPDDGFPGSGQPCTVPGQTAGTPCAQGLTNCLGGQTGCTQTVFATTETCDGKDNDCNGTIDDPTALDGVACQTTFPGVCTEGLTKCSSGALSCQPKISPNTQLETCNALDDDCDGQVDDVANLNLECGQKLPAAGKVATWACTVGFCSITTCVSNWGDCDGVPSNGCESDLLNSALSCGTCSKVCNATNGSPYCQSGTCKIACDPGFGNCDGNADNGCETPLTSSTNCGGCGVGCTNPNGSTQCSLMTCVPTCNSGYGNCDANANNGCETNTQTNTNNCGTCGTQCVNPNGTTSCAGGTCVPVCASGWASCDANAVNGCETNLDTNVNNCGGCNIKCTNVNGTTSCVSGTCSPVCQAGTADCDGNPNNGCETNTSSNINNCGGCGTVCSNPNGTTSCVSGTCSPVCAAGFSSCDGNPVNGCETNLQSSISNCGACLSACTNPNGSTSCISGVCSPLCSTGYGDCDGNVKNGCETNTTSSLSNCGTCGTACTNAHGTTACTSSVCSPSCSAGWSSCDSNPNNGCETNTDADVNNCGSCGTKCTNPNGSVSCSGGTCQLGCTPGFANCDGNSGNGCETNINTNVNNCGGCGQTCVNPNGSTACVSGGCAPACLGGWGSCDGNPNNGCETNLTNSVNNCGACGLGCTNAHGTTSCSAGSCAPVCAAGWGNCDGNNANGCETNLNTTTDHCGACGTKCTNPNGTTSCSAGACVPSCNIGSASCDSNPVNGCETNTLNNTSHCGGCNITCSNNNGSTVCSSGACSPTCNAGYASCDGNSNNGCEVNITNDSNNCGTCGTSCTSPMPANTSDANCQSSVCKVTSCAPNWYDNDGTHANGCECQADATANTCGAGTNLGTVPIGASGNVSGNLVPAGDEDWYQITYQAAATCSFRPDLTLTAGTAPIAMQVYTSCTAGGFACTEGGTTTNTANLKTWDYNHSAACGDNQPIDPTPNLGSYIQVPTTIWVRVFATASSTSCLSYTLSWSN